MKVYKNLAMARKKLQESGLKKTGKGYGFSYFELSDFLPTITDIFDELGLCSFTTIDTELAKMTICDSEDDSTVTFQIPFANFKSDDKRALQEVQELGGSVTYMTRYLWVQVMNIVEPDSVDRAVDKIVRQEVTRTQPRQQPAQQPAQQQSNDPRPTAGAKWTDDDGTMWIVRERKADGARFWAAMDDSNRTSHIGTLEEALNSNDE